MVVTGTSMGKNEKAGRLIFYNKDTFEKVSMVENMYLVDKKSWFAMVF